MWALEIGLWWTWRYTDRASWMDAPKSSNSVKKEKSSKMERASNLSLRGAISMSKSKLKLNYFISLVTNMVVFTFLDLLDGLFCVICSYIDHLLEGSNGSSTCYCHRNKNKNKNKKETTSGNGNGSGSGGGEVPVAVDRASELSETLFQRKNVFRELIKRILILMMGRDHFESREKNEEKKKRSVRAEGTTSSSLSNLAIIRWSDCRCSSCSSWTKAEANLGLHYVLLQPSGSGADQLGLDSKVTPNSTNDILFLHGFLSSSSLWTETVFPNLSESARRSSRLFAVDVLGFGRSPKPRNCLYTLRDHLEMIENSVISPFIFGSEEEEESNFHLVAHSMGCVLAAALAAKYPTSVNSLTLVAPPYFPQLPKDISSSSSYTVLEKLAPKRLWPPLLFGAAFMSWYEHLGRIICFLICRSHRAWESILKLLTRKRDLPFVIADLPRHTHHSAWHTMHNVICHGVTLMDDYLDTLVKHGVKVVVVQGDQDQVVPLECSYSLKRRLPRADLRIVQGEDHSSVVIARPKDFATDLESVWASTSSCKRAELIN